MKFEYSDERYFADRNKLSEKYGQRELWSVADHWPLYCGIANLARCVAIMDILRTTLSVPGHIAEIGSWRGANLLFLAKLLRIFDPHSLKQVHCFESFEGLNEFATQDAGAVSAAGRYKGSFEELLDIINLYELQNEVIVHKGRAEDTIAPFLSGRTELSFSFVYVDVDLYEPTKRLLAEFHPRMMPGSVFVFDEWNIERFPGETVAVREFMSSHEEFYGTEHVPNTRQPSLILRRKTC